MGEEWSNFLTILGFAVCFIVGFVLGACFSNKTSDHINKDEKPEKYKCEWCEKSVERHEYNYSRRFCKHCDLYVGDCD